MQNKASEPTPLYEYPPVRKHMSPEDVALCQQAIELAHSGQKQAAGEYPDRFSSTSLSQTKKSRTWLWIMLGIATLLFCSCAGPNRTQETPVSPTPTSYPSAETTPTATSRPYPWNVTIDSGFTREATWEGVPIGSTKDVSLSITLENASNEILYPAGLQWALIDRNGTITEGTVSGFLYENNQGVQPGESLTVQVDFQVPIAAQGWTLRLSSPAGTDPITWNIP